MNDPDETLPDELLSDLLKPLREATIPAKAQMANRQAVQRALVKQARSRWWRRSIAVPIPVAAAASIALAVATVSLMWPTSAQPHFVHDASKGIANPNQENSSGDVPVVGIPTRPAWRVTQSYIQSLPTLGEPKVFVESYAKENHNDS